MRATRQLALAHHPRLRGQERAREVWAQMVARLGADPGQPWVADAQPLGFSGGDLLVGFTAPFNDELLDRWRPIFDWQEEFGVRVLFVRCVRRQLRPADELRSSIVVAPLSRLRRSRSRESKSPGSSRCRKTRAGPDDPLDEPPDLTRCPAVPGLVAWTEKAAA
jgi:hypothetical protein